MILSLYSALSEPNQFKKFYWVGRCEVQIESESERVALKEFLMRTYSVIPVFVAA
jgi:hypothetical protein